MYIFPRLHWEETWMCCLLYTIPIHNSIEILLESPWLPCLLTCHNAVSTLSCLGFALIKTWTQCIWSQLKSWTTYTRRDFRGPWSWPYSFHTLVCGPFPGSLSLPTALSSALYTEIKLASLSYAHSTLHTHPKPHPVRVQWLPVD